MTARAEVLPFVNLFGFASMAAAALADRLGEIAQNCEDALVLFTRGVSE